MKDNRDRECMHMSPFFKVSNLFFMAFSTLCESAASYSLQAKMSRVSQKTCSKLAMVEGSVSLRVERAKTRLLRMNLPRM